MKRKKTKILFVHPSGKDIGLKIQGGLIYPPLGVAFLGSVVRTEGYDARIFDANIEAQPFRTLEKIIKDYKPDVVGISFTSALS